MTRRAYLLLAFLLAFTAGLVILLVIYVADAKAWTSYPANRHIYNSEAVLSGGGTITDRSGVILAQTVDGKRVYNSKAEIRKAVLHMVGDSDGFIKTGLQSSYWEQLVAAARNQCQAARPPAPGPLLHRKRADSALSRL